MRRKGRTLRSRKEPIAEAALAHGSVTTRDACESAERDPMGCVDCDGQDHFNFEQRIFLHPEVTMRATARFTRAAEALAANILLLALPDDPSSVALAVRLAKPFYFECLTDLPSEDWCIPLETIRAWVGVRADRDSLTAND